MNENSLKPQINTPLAFTKNLSLTLVAQYVSGRGGKRRYTAAQAINELAITKFRPNGKGVIYRDFRFAATNMTIKGSTIPDVSPINIDTQLFSQLLR